MLATRGKVPKRPRGARVLELDVKFIFLKLSPKRNFIISLTIKKTASMLLLAVLFTWKFSSLYQPALDPASLHRHAGIKNMQ